MTEEEVFDLIIEHTKHRATTHIDDSFYYLCLLNYLYELRARRENEENERETVRDEVPSVS